MASVDICFAGERIRIATAGPQSVRIHEVRGDEVDLRFNFPHHEATSARFDATGTRVVASTDDGSAWVWSNPQALSGIDDPRLWTATNYCIPVDRRMASLSTTEDRARDNHEQCLERVMRIRHHPTVP